MFNREYVLGRVLVRGPLSADHVSCAFLGPGKPAEDQGGKGEGKGDGKDGDVVGLVEKVRFDWNVLVVADEPHSGIVCRAYLRLANY